MTALSRRHFARWVPYSLVGALALLHWGALFRFTVDIPLWDEWELIPGLARIHSAHDWRWFFEPFNEHVMAFAKGEVFLSYLWDGWNLRTLQLFNFGVYLFTGGLLWAFARRYLPSVRPAQFLFFLFPLLPLAWENHSMGFQINVHLMLLFLGAAGWGLFCSALSWPALLASVAVNGMAMINVSSGAVLALILALGHATSLLIRARAGGRLPTQWRTKLAISLFLHATLFLLFLRLSRNGDQAGLVANLFVGRTWSYFFHLVVFGFGFDKWNGLSAYSHLFAVPLIAFILAPFWILRRRLSDGHWAMLAWTLALLAGAFLISLARQALGLEGARSSRYHEFVVPLVPLAAFAWSEALAPWTTARKRVLVGYGAFLFLAYADNWNFHAYRVMAESRLRSLRCARELVNGARVTPVCDEASPHPLPPYLKTAQELHLHFLRD